MYVLQVANVRWNGCVSDKFKLSNGVKQGAILSAILYCVYVNGLFERLRERKTGCWIKSQYFGILGYADDNFLLSPTLEGLQEMIDTCNDYANEHNLKFSTNPIPKKSKTKCMAFLINERELRKLKLGNDDLPWWNYGKHLGNMITNSNNFIAQDLKQKRARYIDKNNEICQEFGFAHPETKFKLNQIYNCHFYGSPIWNLFSHECIQFEKTWNVSFRIMFGLHRETHGYLVEAVSEEPHLKTILIKRFLSFIEQTKNSKKMALKELYNTIKEDTQSITGNNLRRIILLCDKNNVDDLNPNDANDILYKPVPENERWRVGFVKELIDIKYGDYEVDGFTFKEIDDILDTVCIC